jgi:DNA-binding Lrp family transcriptional regulator
MLIYQEKEGINFMYYITITHTIYADEKLPDGAKLLYGLILSLTQGNGLCYANNKYLAKTLKKTPRSISSYLEKLKDKNYIAVNIINNNYRLIKTIDTTIGIKNHKKPLKNEYIHVSKQIGVSESEWFNEYVEELKKMEE